MIEQKLLRLKNDSFNNDLNLSDYFNKGWRVKKFSACANQTYTYCFVLLERHMKKEKTKKE